MYATLLSMQQDDIVRGLEALTRKAREIVLGKSSDTTTQPDQPSNNDSLTVIQTDAHSLSEPTVIPPPTISNANTTPMLF